MDDLFAVGFAAHPICLFCCNRHIYFIFDPPHLLKTLRNNLLSSSKHLWNEEAISWEPIKHLILQDLPLLPRKFSHLTRSHVFLSFYDNMKVRLAAQVPQYQYKNNELIFIASK